ncbi:MAG: GAF domain-containing protein, partial [Synechocystis sp.]
MKRLFVNILSKLQTRTSVWMITGLLTGVGIYTVHSINSIANLIDQLYRHPFAVSREITDIKADVYAMHRDLKDVVLAQYPAEIDKTIQEMQTREQEVIAHFDFIDQRFLGDRQIIETVEQSFLEWRTIRDEVIALKQAGRTEEAAAITKGKGSDYVNQLLIDIKEIETFAQNKAQEFAQSANQTQIYLRTVVILLLVSAIGLTFLWTRWLTYLLKQDLVTQNQLTFQARRSEALLELPQYADELDEVAFLQRGQEFAEALTDSKIAFIHFVNDDEKTIELVAWSQATLAHYCRAVADTHYPVDKAGIWAEALRQRQPIVVNDYATHRGKKGLPEGHAHLERLISVPVMDN